MKILVGYAGGTKLDQTVLSLAKQHAKIFNAAIHIATSIESDLEMEPGELDKIESKMETLRDSVRQEGIACETHVLIRGLTPGEDIVEFANDNKVDEIFIGIEKTSKVGKLLFGSNAQHIILEAPCPVISVK
ncbi:MAG: universal stress protein [Syntrophales bacterium]|nr:universal stress protein [Syntrophales bacterium]